jgi:hypothetical protein
MRSFCLTLILVVAMIQTLADAGPVFRADFDPAAHAIRFLSWDTEGGKRVQTNLLGAPASFTSDTSAVSQLPDRIEIIITSAKTPARITFPFDPRITPTTVLPAGWSEDGSFTLPAILSAPDFGLMTLTQQSGPPITGMLQGSRDQHQVEIILRSAPSHEPVRLRLSPLVLKSPDPSIDPAFWKSARRGWLNAVQPCARWGEQNRPYSAPAGILGNNVISDPASCSLWFYADQIFLLPEPAPGVSLLPTLRRTIDYWIDEKMRRDSTGKETGEITCYWDYGNFLDADAGPIIAAWDYVEASADESWLKKKVDRLEMIAEFLIQRDIDHDGLIEATQSGNFNSLQQPNRSDAWWDALNCGHKDAYTDALIYRAFCCLSDLESKLDRTDRKQRYRQRAEQLKADYFKTFFNPQTGWLAWWKSRDGMLHDYASPTLNGLAIEYGLVPPDQAKLILDKLWNKITSVGFTRFDLGVPPMLIPVLRADYLQPDAIGMPHREDGTDTFGVYMNAGITAGQVLHFIDANYVSGDTARADKVLLAMLQRQQSGGFQNGVINTAMQGIDWTTWDGKPCGYEGYLADSFRFLQAVCLRESALRQKLYRPMGR